uniref:Uncharacterized protein n=1 Tax=Zea mays TaxID=4577 RepID=C0PJ30_MAIZE|nr:unknown [Zea mays]
MAMAFKASLVTGQGRNFLLKLKIRYKLVQLAL